jgi:glycosyltransferase involved in cell wall biosynthesis
MPQMETAPGAKSHPVAPSRRTEGAVAAPRSTERASVDVLIQTYNEEANLPHALKSVAGWVNRVFVVDSGSTDGTERIAREMGAEFVPHAWEGYAGQKNWALANLPFASDWTLILDADEAITPPLREEIIALCNHPPAETPETGFYINRYLIFLGKRISHCGYFPSWNLRLFRRGKARYEDRPVHEHMILDGEPGFLKGLMSHEDRRGLEHYIAKHNRYSTLEAEVAYFGVEDNGEGVQARPFGNSIERRRFFRTRVYPRLPAKWFGRFLYMYFLKLGFLDGLNGLRFCLFISSHELFVGLKLLELQEQARRAAAGGEAPQETTRKQIGALPRK